MPTMVVNAFHPSLFGAKYLETYAETHARAGLDLEREIEKRSSLLNGMFRLAFITGFNALVGRRIVGSFPP